MARDQVLSSLYAERLPTSRGFENIANMSTWNKAICTTFVAAILLQVLAIESSKSTLKPASVVTNFGPQNVQGLGGCRKLSSCSCRADDGSVVDLTPLANNNRTPRFQDVPDGTGLYQYSWNPCISFNEGSCLNVAMCQWAPGSSISYYDLGNQSDVDFLVSSSHGLMMQYTGEGGIYIALRTSYIQLNCDPEVEAIFTAQGELIPLSGVYYFTLRSRYACAKGVVTSTSHRTSSPTEVTSPAPTPEPIFSLKTVVELLWCLLLIAAVGVVVLLMILVAIVVKEKTGRRHQSRDENQSKESKGCWEISINSECNSRHKDDAPLIYA